MDAGSQSEALRELASSVVATAGLELVHLELKGEGRGRMLRVYVDRSGGVGIEDCERASQALSRALDEREMEALPGPYTLEVSSPGLDRPLWARADFDRFSGQRARLRTRQPVGGRRNLTGLLEGGGEGGVRLRTEAGGAPITIAWDNVEEARLAPEFPSPPKPGRRTRSVEGAGPRSAAPSDPLTRGKAGAQGPGPAAR
ncbi:MAG: hypothetical protein ACRD1Y_13920 [Terriglobales bacterium]